MAEGETRPSAEAGEVPPERAAVGQRFATVWDIVVLAGVLLALTVGLTTVLVQAWPPPAATGTAADAQLHATRVRILFWQTALLRDARLFLVVVSAGGVGALIHGLRSLSMYVGNRLLRRSWLLKYCLEPFAGAVLALVVYLVLRGGLTTTMAASNDINPYGVAAVAGLVGMFSAETVQKLLKVFETLFSPAEKGENPLPGRTGGPSDPGPDR